MNRSKLSQTCAWAIVIVTAAALFLTSPVSSYAQQIIKKQQVIQKPQLQIRRGDLTIKITRCPPSVVKAGADLNAGFVVDAKSTFPGAVNGVAVDIILTSNPNYPVPAPYAVYSANYANNVLLKGGRENISFAGPGIVNVKLNGTNTIPADTPSGNYYLGAVVDAGNQVNEADEKNNVAFCRIKVVGQETGGKPDLVIPALDFKKVQEKTDSQGNPYWIFNVLITVKNQGSGPAGPFKVLLERNVGAGGAYTTACATCVLDVPGLAAGQVITLPPRQFNNANNFNSLFRATADNTNVVAETNESNNMNAEAFH